MANSVLEAFYILFKIDSKEAKQSLAQIGTALNSVEKVSHSVDSAVSQTANTIINVFGAAGKSIKDVDDKAGGLNASFGRLLPRLLSVGAAFLGIQHSLSYAADLNLLSQQARVNAQELDLWGRAAQNAGGDADTFMNSVVGLSQELTEASAFGTSGAIITLRRLGINALDANGRVKDTLGLLSELSDRFQSLPQAQSFALGKELGLDPGSILLLQRGRAEIEAMVKHQRELGVVTKQNTEASLKFRQEWQDVMYSLRAVGTSVATIALPAFKLLAAGLEKIAGFFQKYPELGRAVLIGLAAVITATLLPALDAAALASAVTFAPFYAAVAVVVALGTVIGLLADDIYIFFKGGNSLIGEFLKKFPLIGEIAKDTYSIFEYLFSSLVNYGRFLGEVFTNPKKAFKDFINSSRAAFQELLSDFPSLQVAIDKITALFKLAGNAISAVWDSVLDAIQAVISGINKGIDFVLTGYNKIKSAISLGEKSQSEVTTVNDALTSAANSPLNFHPLSSVVNSKSTAQINKNNLVQVGDVHIQTQSTDAIGISQEISKSMSNHIRQAINTYDDGVLS